MTETSGSEEEPEDQRDQVDDISRVPSPSDGKARRADKKFAAATSPPNTEYKTSSPYVEADVANAGNPGGAVPPSRKSSTRGSYPFKLRYKFISIKYYILSHGYRQQDPADQPESVKLPFQKVQPVILDPTKQSTLSYATDTAVVQRPAKQTQLLRYRER